MEINHEKMMYIPPEVEVCLFGMDEQLGQFIKHELVMRKIPNFSPTKNLFNPQHGDLMLHLADGLRPRAFLNCIDDPQILVNLCECCVKYDTRFIHMGRNNTDIPKMFRIHNFASIKYDNPDIAMVKKLMDNLDHVIGFHTYKEGKFTTIN